MAAARPIPRWTITDGPRSSCCRSAARSARRHAGVGQLPIPQQLLTQGVRDMVRISDARMSGTSYGACVLHVSPESFYRRADCRWSRTAT